MSGAHPMSPERKAELEKRWQECERQIQAIHAGKVVDGDPAEAEGQLLHEQDAIEFELGMEYFLTR
jgi:hypothetical protein